VNCLFVFLKEGVSHVKISSDIIERECVPVILLEIFMLNKLYAECGNGILKVIAQSVKLLQ
jgi:hypothetical protein